MSALAEMFAPDGAVSKLEARIASIPGECAALEQQKAALTAENEAAETALIEAEKRRLAGEPDAPVDDDDRDIARRKRRIIAIDQLLQEKEHLNAKLNAKLAAMLQPRDAAIIEHFRGLDEAADGEIRAAMTNIRSAMSKKLANSFAVNVLASEGTANKWSVSGALQHKISVNSEWAQIAAKFNLSNEYDHRSVLSESENISAEIINSIKKGNPK